MFEYVTENIYPVSIQICIEGVQWLSGRVLDSRSMGKGLEPHRRHYVVSLSKTLILCL